MFFNIEKTPLGSFAVDPVFRNRLTFLKACMVYLVHWSTGGIIDETRNKKQEAEILKNSSRKRFSFVGYSSYPYGDNLLRDNGITAPGG